MTNLTEEILNKNFPDYEESDTIGWWPETDGLGFTIYFVSEECELTCRHVTTVEKLQKILDVCGLDTNISSYLSHGDPFL